MTKKISILESTVIQNWLKGMSRDQNAVNCGVSTGYVSNIMKNFTESLIGYNIESIRDLVVQVRKENLTVKECAFGLRVHNILYDLGISDDEDFQVFLKDLLALSARFEVNPQVMKDCLEQIIKISKQILPSQLKTFIQNQIEEKDVLQKKIADLSNEINKIEKAKSEAEEKYVLTKSKINVSTAELEWYANIKDALEKEGIPVDDISFLTRTIETIKKYSNKKLFETLQKINDLDSLNHEIESKKRTIDIITIDVQNILQLDSQYLESLSSKTLLSDCLDEINKLGFGLHDLKRIRDVLNEIAFENGKSVQMIKERFFEQLFRYEKNISTERDLELLENSISNLEETIQKNRRIIHSQSSVGVILKNLLNKGFKEDDIVMLKKFLDINMINNTKQNNFESMSDMKPSSSQQMSQNNDESLITWVDKIISNDLNVFSEKNNIIFENL